MEFGKTICIACQRNLDEGIGIGLIGNGGLVCKVCYLAAPDAARQAAGHNPAQTAEPEYDHSEEDSFESVRST